MLYDVKRMLWAAFRAESLVILDPSGAFPKTKLTRCSCSTSSVTPALMDASIKRSSSGRRGAGFRTDFRAAMTSSQVNVGRELPFGVPIASGHADRMGPKRPNECACCGKIAQYVVIAFAIRQPICLSLSKSRGAHAEGPQGQKRPADTVAGAIKTANSMIEAGHIEPGMMQLGRVGFGSTVSWSAAESH
jgi:hypothetical protein